MLSNAGTVVAAMQLNNERFIDLLRKLIAETPHLMNKLPTHVPKEMMAARHVLEALAPYSTEKGGVLKIKTVCYQDQRANVIVEYPGLSANTPQERVCSFIGSHLDVVFANPKDWKSDPFSLQVDGDFLRGRGTTDCLGHVALITDMFIQLATQRPPLQISVFAVFIADEEVGEDPTIGVQGLMQNGELARLKNGPVYWVDSADKQPTIGTGGCVQWSLVATGKMVHSGHPIKGINAIELASDAMRYIQQRFYLRFPRHPAEAEYGFPCPSSIKTTNVIVPDGSLNQIRGQCTLQGDIRTTPFYRIKEVMNFVESVVGELNAQNFSQLSPHGPSPYHIPASRAQHGDHKEEAETKALLEIKWMGGECDGLACDLKSSGYRYLADATRKFVGHLEPIATTGTLPLVSELKDFGWDVQVTGYGVEDAYHADDEYAKLSDFQQGFKVLMEVVARLDSDCQRS